MLLLLFLPLLLQIQPLEHRIELIVEGEDKAEPFDELVDLCLEFLVLQMDLAYDLFQVEHELVQIVEGFEGLRQAETYPANLLPLRYCGAATFMLYMIWLFSLRKKAQRMTICTLSSGSGCLFSYRSSNGLPR